MSTCPPLLTFDAMTVPTDASAGVYGSPVKYVVFAVLAVVPPLASICIVQMQRSSSRLKLSDYVGEPVVVRLVGVIVVVPWFTAE
jgi:hypothetical protein